MFAPEPMSGIEEVIVVELPATPTWPPINPLMPVPPLNEPFVSFGTSGLMLLVMFTEAPVITVESSNSVKFCEPVPNGGKTPGEIEIVNCHFTPTGVIAERLASVMVNVPVASALPR